MKSFTSLRQVVSREIFDLATQLEHCTWLLCELVERWNLKESRRETH